MELLELLSSLGDDMFFKITSGVRAGKRYVMVSARKGDVKKFEVLSCDCDEDHFMSAIVSVLRAAENAL